MNTKYIDIGNVENLSHRYKALGNIKNEDINKDREIYKNLFNDSSFFDLKDTVGEGFLKLNLKPSITYLKNAYNDLTSILLYFVRKDLIFEKNTQLIQLCSAFKKFFGNFKFFMNRHSHLFLMHKLQNNLKISAIKKEYSKDYIVCNSNIAYIFTDGSTSSIKRPIKICSFLF